MKAIFNSNSCSNWTKGKAYEVQPSFVRGYASILDDNGAEQIVHFGSTDFLWEKGSHHRKGGLNDGNCKVPV